MRVRLIRFLYWFAWQFVKDCKHEPNKIAKKMIKTKVINTEMQICNSCGSYRYYYKKEFGAWHPPYTRELYPDII